LTHKFAVEPLWRGFAGANMTLARGTAIAVALGLLAGAEAVHGAQSPADRRAAPPIEPITGLPLPLLEGDRLVRLKDGCQLILDESAAAHSGPELAEQRWLGACRFGLVHGPGFMASKSGTSPSVVHMRFGRRSRQPDDPDFFAKGKLRDTQWWFHIFETPDQARAWTQSHGGGLLPESILGDLSWSTDVAHIRRAGSTEAPDETLVIWIDHEPCLRGGGRKSIAQSFVELLKMSPANADRVAPFCQAAFARLQRERPDLISDYEWEPYRTLDWGYYHQVRIMRFKGASVETGKPDQEEIVVCPSPGDSSSCKQVWAPVIAPYLQIREAERKREAEANTRRQQMIDALEAAFAEKLKIRSLKAASRSSQ
jgi:hypothetical protein